MDFIEFEFGSAKNIPLANKKEYMEMIIQAMEKFNSNLSWHVLFKLNPHLVSKGIETFGFNSCRAAPRMKELKEFEKDLVKLVQNGKFRKRSNPFLKTLKKEVSKISERFDYSCRQNIQQIFSSPGKYLGLMDREIQKRYKKETPEKVEAVNEDQTFLTLKDQSSKPTLK